MSFIFSGTPCIKVGCRGYKLHGRLVNLTIFLPKIENHKTVFLRQKNSKLKNS